MKGKKIIQFIKSPSPAPFFMAYFVDDVVEVNDNQAEALIEAGVAKEYIPEKKAAIPLPADMPARDKLIKAGVNSLDELKLYTDLTEINGIGKALAEQISKFLKG
jgi:predicted flap endonuclease-1-like 5' DNA nuclease